MTAVPAYTTREVAEITGATFRQLDYWERTGILKAAKAARGSGSRRSWSPRNVHVATVLATLTSAIGNEHIHDLLCRVALEATASESFEVPLGKGLTLVYTPPMIDEEER